MFADVLFVALRSLRLQLVLGTLLASGPCAAGSQDDGSVRVRARDSRTGLAVEADIADALRGDVVATSRADAPGVLARDAGRRPLEVRARGYRALRTQLEPRVAEPLELTVWLDPLGPEAEAVPVARPGQALVHGLVFDATSGQPLADVRVRLERVGAETISDGGGAFALEAPAPVTDPLAELPAADVLLASRPGFMTTRVVEVLLTEGATRLSIGMLPGSGTRLQGEAHKLRRGARELAVAQEPPPAAELRPGAPPGVGARALPESIRVGFDCTCASCSSVQVFSLDTYVRLGLDDEWIPSWHEEALRAGAVAYRSYGSWHVLHPRAAGYDICSTTCCQVIDPSDSSARVDAAVAATAGLVVVDAAAEPFLAEYSAENNDEACPDGFAGRPDHDWPCLADPVDAGTSFLGHGRGMCQWGTQRWAAGAGRDHRWLVDHYYSDNGHPAGKRSGTLVGPPPGDFSVDLRPTAARVKRGGTAAFEVWVTPRDGFDGPVDLSVAGTPGGASARLSLPVVRTSGMSVLTVATTKKTATGSFRLTVTGASGGLARAGSAQLTVTR